MLQSHVPSVNTHFGLGKTFGGGGGHLHYKNIFKKIKDAEVIAKVQHLLEFMFNGNWWNFLTLRLSKKQKTKPTKKKNLCDFANLPSCLNKRSVEHGNLQSD